MAERDRERISIRLDPDLLARLEEAATERGLSRNVLIERALGDFMDRLIPLDKVQLTRPYLPRRGEG